MNVVFLGLGGNMGDREAYLERTRAALEKECGVIIMTSKIYETAAWGSNSDKKYLNQVIKLHTHLSAQALLKKTLAIEKKLGRIRTYDRNASRTVDIDLLFYNDIILRVSDLELPHPRIHLRKFVLIPFCDIAPDFVHPALKKSMRSILKSCSDTLEVTPFVPRKKLKYICIEGNIGSGKSTLAKALSKKLKAKLILETFEDNTLLALFYKNPSRYAVPLEYSFLIQRFEQLILAHGKDEKPIVSDFNFHKCLWFAKVNLPGYEFRLFKKHFTAMSELLPEADLLIHLSTSTKNLKQNIATRGRGYESGISNTYLRSLSAEYRNGLLALKKPKILEITVKKYEQTLEKQLLDRIENYVKENFG